MRYTHYLLDADETILDFVSSSKLSLQYCLSRCNAPYSEENFRLFKKFNDAVWREYERGEITKSRLRVARFERFFAALEIDCDARRADEIYFDKLCETGILLPQADAFLAELKRRGKICLITNGTTAAQNGRLRVLGIHNIFDGLYISDELGVAKPDPVFFEKVLDDCKVQKTRCVVIGDSLSSDIAGANSAGIECIKLNRNAQPVPSFVKPTYIAESYREILEIIDRS